MRLLVLLVAAAGLGSAQVPGGERWLAHLTDDLLPFWSQPTALGNPVGAFPAVRCNDGSLVNLQNPCAPVAGNPYLLGQVNSRYLVSHSRQTYGYGVAYHMTGDARYLAWMKAGIDYLRSHFIDRVNGGMFVVENADAARDPQQLGYGLLCLAFYYYLTRDAAVLDDILALNIFDNYWNDSVGAMQWAPGSTARNLVADLDQTNTYLVLLTPILPEPARTEWAQALLQISRSMLGVYYSPALNLLIPTPDSPNADVDFGHTAKGLWMMRFAGRIAGDRTLANLAEAKARRHLESSFVPEDGSWAQGYVSGAWSKDKNWWIYAELDQLAGTLDTTHLPETTAYWFNYFVDRQHGEVWNGVAYLTNAPLEGYPKQWQWKNAYHSFEHALVGYITANQFYRQPFKLHYAFVTDADPASIQPYYFSGRVDSITRPGPNLQTVWFAAADAPPATPPFATVSAADFLPGPLAPGSLASAFGTFGTDAVSVNGRTATVLYSSATQINFLIPAETPAGSVPVTIGDQTAALEIVPVAPSVFQVDPASLAAAWVIRVKADSSQAVESILKPVDVSTDAVYLELYGTGLRNAAAVTATADGVALPVLYAGPHSLFAGLDQVNVGPLRRSLSGRGSVNIIIAADGQTANPVRIAVR